LTETGEKYLVAPYSVDRHITYINEVRTVANSRDQTRTDANVRIMENKGKEGTSSRDQTRTFATFAPPTIATSSGSKARTDFYREQIGVKDGQIKELTERARETNVLIAGLQKMLTPLLGRPPETETNPHGWPAPLPSKS